MCLLVRACLRPLCAGMCSGQPDIRCTTSASVFEVLMILSSLLLGSEGP